MLCGRWFAILVLLAGCSGWRAPEKTHEAKLAPSKYRFDYTLSNAEPVSLLRVFDDGGSTYFQFRSSPPEALVISAQTRTGEAIIPHEHMGNYAVIRGVYQESRFPSANLPVVARKIGGIVSMADLGPVVLPTTIPQAAPPAKAEPVPVVNQEAAVSSTYRIRFARNASRLGPRGKADLVAALKDTAHAAAIDIRVRPFYASRSASVRLAEARAAVLRAALTAAGQDESRIRIDTQSAREPLIAELVLHASEQGSAQPSTATIVGAGPLLQATEHRSTLPAMVAIPFMQGAFE